ncbi:MAG: SRPBCC family protein [Brevinematales bacterium]|nr:SRPBCC family protein [Brevinematales bacterium]
MKKIFVLFLVIFFTSCITTTEKYRYQQRVDNFYHLFNEQEWNYFKKADFVSASQLISERLKNDKKFLAKWKKVQYDEAIATFDVEQTLKFFYEIIFKELNKIPYYKFMEFLSQDLTMRFINKEYKALEDFYNSNNEFKKFVDNLKKEYRLYKFTNEEVFSFLREIVFKEMTQKRFYDFCSILSELKVLYEFEKGNLTNIDNEISKGLSRTLEIKLDRFYSNTGLKGLPFSDLVKVYYNVVMKEMDKGAVIQTLHKF